MEPYSSSGEAVIDLVDLAPAFDFVVREGLVHGARNYQPQAFGNAVVVMVGAPLYLRFQRDRGQVFVDAGSCLLYTSA